MYDTILFPTDGTEGVDRATDHAIDAADRYDATLHVLYVVDTDVVNAYPGDEFVRGAEGAEETLEDTGRTALDAVAARAESAGVDVVTHLGYGTPHEEILRYITEEDVDLTVMGSKAHSGEYRQLLGSVTERVSRQSTAPVSIVKTTVEG